jgi:hypothetical protein
MIDSYGRTGAGVSIVFVRCYRYKPSPISDGLFSAFGDVSCRNDSGCHFDLTVIVSHKNWLLTGFLVRHWQSILFSLLMAKVRHLAASQHLVRSALHSSDYLST